MHAPKISAILAVFATLFALTFVAESNVPAVFRIVWAGAAWLAVSLYFVACQTRHDAR